MKEIAIDSLVMVIDGRTHTGWKTAQLSRSIERGPHNFKLMLTDRWGHKESTNPRSVLVGMSTEIYINDDLIISGYIDEVTPSYTVSTHRIGLSGWSKLGDLVGCSTQGKQFKNQSLFSICQALCKPFSISVSVTDSAKKSATKVFAGRAHTLDLGQTLWDFMEELARLRGVLLTSDAQGNLVILRAGTATADVALYLGKNIKTGSGSFSGKNLYSEYNVSGQQPTVPKAATYIGAKVSQPKAQAKAQVSSKGVGRYRPFYISSDNPLSNAQCLARANWQKSVHDGRAETITYTLSGWRQQAGGRLWQPNELVSVIDPWMGLDEQRLIVATDFSLDEDGSNTGLTVMPKSAFAEKPAEPKKVAKNKKAERGYLLPGDIVDGVKI